MTEHRSIAFRLRVRRGPDVGTELLVPEPIEGPIMIGRGVDGGRDLLCTDSKVSRRHASIEATAEGYFVTDHGSTNRTRLNGRLLRPDVPVPLCSGDELALGPDTLVTFEVPSSETELPHHAGRPRYEFGPYAVYENVSKGSVDRIDRAINTRTEATVALKRYARHLSRRVRQRIRDEAEQVRSWRHESIASVLDVGEEGGVLYVASRFVDGVNLSQLVRQWGSEIDAPLAAYIIRDACAALQYARETVADFVHRNLTPRTIMLGRSGEVALLNVGFTPVETLLVGTTLKMSRTRLRYLAPERRLQHELDHRSNIFSLGIMLYELLAGQAVDPRRLRDLQNRLPFRPGVPPALAALTLRTLSLRPEDRFHSAGEMQLEIDAILYETAPSYGAADAARWMAKIEEGR